MIRLRGEEMYKIGLVSVSFRQASVEGIVKLAARAGLECIEWGSDVHAPVGDVEGLQRIAALQKAYNIRCASYGTYFRLGQTPLCELDGYIRAAKILGTTLLRLWCGERGSADYSPTQRAKLVSICRAAAEIAEKQQVTLCVECHHGTLTDTLESALALMTQVNSPCFKMYWQPNQFQSIAQNVRYAEAIAPFTAHLHVFNWQGENRYPLKAGLDAWKRYLSCFDGERTLLLEFMPDDRPESLPNEAAALKELIR